MSLGSPWMLLWLAAVPALVIAYAWALRLRAERAARLASDGLVPTAPARRVRWRRHIPFALFAAAVGARLLRARAPDRELRRCRSGKAR